MSTIFFVGLIVNYLCGQATQASLFDDLLHRDRNEYPTEYGVDVTFPIHHGINRHRYAQHHNRYLEMMQGCYNAYGQAPCDSTERSRMNMNREQPRLHHNYTKTGFKLLKAPKAAWEPLLAFYRENQHHETPENWPAGNTYVNHWSSPTSMISFEDSQLRSGRQVKNLIWAAVKPIIEEWTGQVVEPTSLYGIRVYKAGAMLSTHVDRLPLVSSAIIQVAQQVNEPWPIEVYDHDGHAHNATMQPGDMLLYESHTVLHGRPFPLNGLHYANVFVHFKPVQHEELNANDPHLHPELQQRAREIALQQRRDEEELRQRQLKDNKQHIKGKSASKGVGGHEHEASHLPDPFRRTFTHVFDKTHHQLQQQDHPNEKDKIEEKTTSSGSALHLTSTSTTTASTTSTSTKSGAPATVQSQSIPSEQEKGLSNVGGVEVLVEETKKPEKQEAEPVAERGEELKQVNKEQKEVTRDAAAEAQSTVHRLPRHMQEK